MDSPRDTIPTSGVPRAAAPGLYGEDLAAIHSDGFLDIARAAAIEATARLATGSRVLDVGCGDGTTIGLLAAAGHEVVGVDRSPAMVRLARERHPGLDVRVDGGDSGGLPRGLDAVLAVGEVLAYAGERPSPLAPRLARLLALLRPGGLLLFDVPSPGRAADGDQRTWSAGDGWAVLVSTTASGSRLTRDIVTFRRLTSGDWRRSDERHVLDLTPPDRVIAALAGSGAVDPETLPGYASLTLPAGLVAYAARAPAAG